MTRMFGRDGLDLC